MNNINIIIIFIICIIILLFYFINKFLKIENFINNERYKIIIYTDPLDIKHGGSVVMYYLAKIINDLNNNNFYAKLYVKDNSNKENMFCNDFANKYEIDNNTIVIYPETIPGNPLNAKYIVRWILFKLGGYCPEDQYKNWNPNDLVYFWEDKSYKTNKFKTLRYHWLNPIFTNKNLERTKTCYLVKKGKIIHKTINYFHPINSICIDDLDIEEIANIFNESTYLYCYDPKSMYISYAIFCGCVPILYPINNQTKREYCIGGVFNKNNKIYDKGFAWGNSQKELDYANNTLKEADDEIHELFESDKETIYSFVDDMKIYIDNPNNKNLSFNKDIF